MKLKLIKTGLLFALLASTTAFAQSKSFEGFSVGLNGSFVGPSVRLEDSGQTVELGKTTLVSSVETAYTFVINRDYVMGIGLTYNLNDLKAGSAAGFNTKLENAYSIYLEPGYMIKNDTQLYAKVSYNAGKGKLEDPLSSSLNKDLHGYGYGVGLRSLMNKNWFIQVEATQTDYNSMQIDTTNLKAKAASGTVGIGYLF